MLTDRLNAIKELVPSCDLAVDIGTDHAWLPIALIQEEKVKKVIASDVKKSPLEIAAKNVSRYSIDPFIELRQGDGLQVLFENEVPPVIILAGMGGLTITNILSDRKNSWMNKSELILQPQGNYAEVRHYLISHNYDFFRERIVEDRGKFYQIIHASPVHENDWQFNFNKYTVFELEYGSKLLKSKSTVVKAYLKTELSKTKAILENIQNSRDAAVGDRKNYFEEKYSFLLEVLRNDISK